MSNLSRFEREAFFAFGTISMLGIVPQWRLAQTNWWRKWIAGANGLLAQWIGGANGLVAQMDWWRNGLVAQRFSAAITV